MIYFLQNPVTTNIKIGTSKAFSRRRLDIETEVRTKCVLLGVMKGNLHEERSLHNQFSPFRVNGEWFLASKQLLEYIAENSHEWDGVDEVEPLKLVVLSLSAEAHRQLNGLAGPKGLKASEYVRFLIMNHLRGVEPPKR